MNYVWLPWWEQLNPVLLEAAQWLYTNDPAHCWLRVKTNIVWADAQTDNKTWHTLVMTWPYSISILEYWSQVMKQTNAHSWATLRCYSTSGQSWLLGSWRPDDLRPNPFESFWLRERCVIKLGWWEDDRSWIQMLVELDTTSTLSMATMCSCKSIANPDFLAQCTLQPSWRDVMASLLSESGSLSCETVWV